MNHSFSSMDLTKLLADRKVTSFITISRIISSYKVFRYKILTDSFVSPVFVTFAGDQENLGLTLESQEDSQDHRKHILKVTDPDLKEKFRDLELDPGLSYKLQEVCGVKAGVLNHRDLLEYIRRLDVNIINFQLYFTETNDFEEPEDKTVMVTFKLTRPSKKLQVDVENKRVLTSKAIDLVPIEGHDYEEDRVLVRSVKSRGMYVFVEEDGTLGVSPLSTQVTPKAVFVRRQYTGFTRAIPKERRVFPNGREVIVHLFHRDTSGCVKYVTNTKDKIIMTNRGQPIQGKTLDERDPRFYYFEKVPGTSYCLFICSCFSGTQFLSYNEKTKSLCLKQIENTSTLDKHHDDVKFELISPEAYLKKMEKKTTV